ncbi:MAG: AAA family ATPase, partial [Desulfuromonadaceae bacterium]|nr:AAA family ATPase [Desulfuromonadaceae bacterium]
MARRRLFNKLNIPAKLDSETRKYMPLFGTWLLDMAIVLNWHKPTSPRYWPDIFNDNDFCALTGMTPMDEIDGEDDSKKTITLIQCRKVLLNQREQLQKMKLSPQLPLFKNVELLAKLLELSEADKAVITFAAGLSMFPEFNNAIRGANQKVAMQSFCRLMALLTGINESEMSRACALDSPLVSSGLVRIKRQSCDLEDKISLMHGLEGVMQTAHEKIDDLVACFMRRAAAPSLTLDNFPHLRTDRTMLTEYLGNALLEKTIGVNVLLHGKPGVGKNEFVQALAAELNVDLYEVSYSDQDGDPIKGTARLQAYSLCQRLLARDQNAMLLFDEVEDVVGSGSSMFSHFFGGDEDDEQTGSNRNGKAWINRTLENNQVPAIWISNKISQIDNAYLRRFDFSVGFPVPPHSVRISMARHHLDCFEPPQNWVERLAANEAITPAQFERAAKVARIASSG